MKIYAVQSMDRCDYDFSTEMQNLGAFTFKANAIKKAREIFENTKLVYADEIKQHDPVDVFIESDDEYGYYSVAFGRNEHYECHSVAVEEFDILD